MDRVERRDRTAGVPRPFPSVARRDGGTSFGGRRDSCEGLVPLLLAAEAACCRSWRHSLAPWQHAVARPSRTTPSPPSLPPAHRPAAGSSRASTRTVHWHAGARISGPTVPGPSPRAASPAPHAEHGSCQARRAWCRASCRPPSRPCPRRYDGDRLSTTLSYPPPRSSSS